MARVITPWIGRRSLLAAASAATASLLVSRSVVAVQPRVVATPRQTEGPFYPVEWTGDIDNDLVVVTGEATQAQGQILHLSGRVLNVFGRPFAAATVEIWQCDANGIYRHPGDGRGARHRDTGFQGRGRTRTDAAGRYTFRTIRPVAYASRTPHIHFKVMPSGEPVLITQMYVYGEKLNARDAVLNGIGDPRQRDSVIVRLGPAEGLEPGALGGTFDIILG